MHQYKSLNPLKDISLLSLFEYAGGLGFLAVIDPSLSMPRDWDSFLFHIHDPLGSSLVSPNANLVSFQKMIIPGTLLGLITTASFLTVNITSESSIAHTKYIATVDMKKSMGTAMILRDYYKDRGNQRMVDSLNSTINLNYMNHTKMNEGARANKKM